MRNPERISYIIDLLERIWKFYPDTRFNQLIDILQYDFCDQDGNEKWFKEYKEDEDLLPKYVPDLFYLEDSEFEKFLEKYLYMLKEDCNKI